MTKFSKSSAPECFNRGSSLGIPLDSRKKHAGMTNFANGLKSMKQAAEESNPPRLNDFSDRNE
jgi:hypothetical protein